MSQSSAGTMMHASSHWLVNSDVMSGLRAVGLQSDALFGRMPVLQSIDDLNKFPREMILTPPLQRPWPWGGPKCLSKLEHVI